MYPEIFRIGSFPVNTYGVLLALAFLVALFVAARLGERDGLTRERVFDLGLWMLVAALVGSKLLLLIVEPEYRENLRNLFTLDFLRSGGVFYGGFIGAVATGYLLVKRYKLAWWKVADAFAPGIALGQAIGRQGCFAAGCCWGKPTTLPWGVKFTEAGHAVTGVPTDTYIHPTQLYESFAALAIFFILLRQHKRKTFDGQVIALYAVLYSVVRFSIEFVRDDPRGDLFGLTTLTGLSTSQLVSLVVFIAGTVVLVLKRQRGKRRAATSEAKAAANAGRA